MRQRRKRHFVIALAVLATLSLTATGYTHGRFRFWWFRPPAPAIQDVPSFDEAEAEDGRVRTIVVTNGQVTSFTREDFDDTTFTASVAGGVLTIDPITLLSDDGLTSVTVTLDAATLQRNFFNSTFSAQGTAQVDTLDAPGGTVVATTTVDVFAFGIISEKNGEYKLRGDVRGLSIVDDSAGTVTYTLFKLELEAETPVPTAP